MIGLEQITSKSKSETKTILSVFKKAVYRALPKEQKKEREKRNID